MKPAYATIVESLYRVSAAILLFAISNSFAISNPSIIFSHLESLPSPCSRVIAQTNDGDRSAKVAMEPSNDAVKVTAVRNLGEEPWLERLEIEVRNVSDKPVYFLVVLMVFPDLKRTDERGITATQVILLKYGRRELLQKDSMATSLDMPIKPGDSYVFKLPENDRTYLERDLAAGIINESVLKRFFISVDMVNFGDGTGFRSGKPYPT